jgi:eukaryotic translation initiation factor 2C
MYNYQLRFPELPCLEGPRKSYFPMEVCTILPGQYYTKKLDEMQTAAMIKKATQRPDERARRIEQGLQELGTGRTEQLQDLGVRIDQRMMNVNGRILQPPSLTYGDKVIFI